MSKAKTLTHQARGCDAAFKGVGHLEEHMPPTEEIVCTDDECYLDMFENHYTYDVPDDHDVTDLACPVCAGTNCLEPVDL